MKEFKEHLEECNGGPLVRDVYMQCELEMADKENDPFDLYEIERIVDMGTEIDKEWRNETRTRP
jgi:hypothetical protein